ncbi:MAG: efflux RND transporter periplasmic adaptor subunit [Alphaproteobacteria bacterium]|nr:efflux RND transporter periplasmic adaptor subunit [Alphaproteobacteria bacterium]
MSIMRPLAFLASAAIAVGLSACGGPADSKENAKAPVVEAIAMSVTKVAKADVAVPITASGSLTPTRQTDIGPSVDGIIDQVIVNVGDKVKKGDVLFKTRDVDIRLQVRQLEKQVALGRAQQSNAQSELKRQNALKGGGWVSASRMDTTKTNAAIAQAQVGVWEAQLAQLQQQLKDTVVRAPYDGVISRKDVYEGRFMATRMGGMGMPGGSSGVVQIMAIDPLAAIALAPANYFTQLKVGMDAKVFIDGMDTPVEAKVAVVNFGVDYKARSVEVRLEVPNKDYKILPGLYCRVELMPEARPALVVDRKAVLGPESARYAFTIDNGRAKKIALSTRELDGERVEILSNVPEGTELLVGANLSQLAHGVPVKVEAPAASAAKPATQAKL